MYFYIKKKLNKKYIACMEVKNRFQRVLWQLKLKNK